MGSPPKNPAQRVPTTRLRDMRRGVARSTLSGKYWRTPSAVAMTELAMVRGSWAVRSTAAAVANESAPGKPIDMETGPRAGPRSGDRRPPHQQDDGQQRQGGNDDHQAHRHAQDG